MNRFLPADIIFAPGSALIRLFQRSPSEPPTWAGHVAGMGTPVDVVEALWRVRSKPWAEWAAHNPQYEVWRHTGLTFDQRLDIADRALGAVHNTIHYGWWKLGIHLGDWGLAWAAYAATLGQRTGELYALRHLLFLDEYPICNWVWAKAYQDAMGYQFGVRATWTTPDTMRDHVLESKDWVRVLAVSSPHVSAEQAGALSA